LSCGLGLEAVQRTRPLPRRLLTDAPVPEPAPMELLAVGLLTLAGVRQRRPSKGRA